MESDDTQHSKRRHPYLEAQSIHGDTVRRAGVCHRSGRQPHPTPPTHICTHAVQAARRRAITELLFFASVGDIRRCQRIVRIWNLQVCAQP